MNYLFPSVRSLLALCLALIALICSADPYTSPNNRFSIAYSAPWSKTVLPDPSAELFLLCDSTVCGPTVLLAFGAFLDNNMKGGKLADFLAHANGDAIVQNVRSTPGVSKVVILKEGRTRLGTVEAYQVLSEITLQNGRKRIRHTFMTFNAGWVYNVSLGCPPEAHERALSSSQAVLNSFAFK